MKIILAIMLAVFMLTSCTDKNQANPSSTEQPASKSEQKSTLSVLTSTTENGYYYYANRDYTGAGKGSLLSFIDFEQKREVVLCSSPSCEHMTEACTARPQTEGSHSVFAYADKLIFFTGAMTEQAARISVSGPTGTDKKTIYTFPNGNDLKDWMYNGLPFAAISEDNIYFFENYYEDNGKISYKRLIKLSLISGKAKTICEGISSDTYTLGVVENNVIVQEVDFSQQHLANGDENIDYALKNKLFLLNCDTGEQTTFKSFESKQGVNENMVMADKGVVYIYNANKKAEQYTLTAINPITSEETIISGNLIYAQQLDGFIDDYILLKKYRATDNTTEPYLRRFAVNIKNGETAELTISSNYASQQRETPATIITQTADNLLITAEVRTKNMTCFGTDMLPYNRDVDMEYMGIISKADFLNNNPSYELISFEE